jgi:hypothetical protein
MRLSRTLASTSVAVAATLGAPAAASALVQVDKGIAGARLGNTRGEVRAALGRPARVISGSNDFGPFVDYRYRGGIRVLFQGRTHVTSVSTTGRGDRTARNVGVGSSEATVKERVKGVKCETIAETIAGIRSCHTGKFNPGEVVTDFLLRSGKVVRVTVGRVID